MNVAVFGLGYVGCVSAACLARAGHRVIGVDVNAEKVDSVARGQSPIVEPGLSETLRAVIDSGALSTTTDAGSAVAATDMALICVGTPSLAHGQPSFEAVRRVAHEIGAALRERRGYRVVLRSTALPGTTDTLVAAALRDGGLETSDVGLAVNPEFMREGASLEDFDHPPFVLVGADDEATANAVAALYATVDAPVVRTSIRTAELVKYASNAFHALKICFANEMASLAASLGADGVDVMRIFSLDRKLNISDAYLRPGFAFGGSCLPKDIRALLWAGHVADVDTPVLAAVLPSNTQMIRDAIDAVLAFGRRRVGVVGLAFKPNTDDLRESPVVTVVEALIGKGLDIRVLDRNVSLARLVGANRRYIETEIPHIASLLCADAQTLLDHADVIVVASRSDDAQAVLAGVADRHVVVDLTRPHASGLVPALRGAGEGERWASRASRS